MSQKIQIVPEKILQRIQGSDMRLDTRTAGLKISTQLCQKLSSISGIFFGRALWESPLERTSPSIRPLLIFCSQGCPCCVPRETQQLAPPTRACWSRMLSREDGWEGSMLSRVIPIPPSHTQCSSTLGKVSWAGRRWKFGSAPACTGNRDGCRTRGKVREGKSMARQPGQLRESFHQAVLPVSC